MKQNGSKQHKVINLGGGPPQGGLPPQNLRITVDYYDGKTGKDLTEAFEGEGVGFDPMLSQGPCLCLMVKKEKNGNRYRFIPYTFIKGLFVEKI